MGKLPQTALSGEIRHDRPRPEQAHHTGRPGTGVRGEDAQGRAQGARKDRQTRLPSTLMAITHASWELTRAMIEGLPMLELYEKLMNTARQLW
jgi:hypothetical protein